MVVDFSSGKKYYCDACKEEIDSISELTIKIDYGCEDECWGSHGAEDKLYDMCRKLQKDNPDSEIQSVLREYSLQNEIHICDDCRNYKTDNYINKFVNKIRDVRAQTLLTLVKNKQLPELMDNERELAIKELEERAKKIIKEIQTEKFSDFGLEDKMTVYSNIQAKIRELQQ